MRLSAKKKILLFAAVLAAGVVVFRLYLPRLALREVNRKLSLLDGYQGRVDRVGLSLWRGAYQIDGVKVDKNGGRVPVPFFSAETIDFSLGWSALLHGKIVTDIKMDAPKINIVKGPTEETSATKPNESFARTLKGLAPFEIDRLEIERGQIRYRDFGSVPKVDIGLTRIEGAVRNLRNTENVGAALPAYVQVKGKAFDTGDIDLALRADLLKDEPTFELKQKLSGVELTRLDDFFDAYAKIRVKSGKFDLYAEAAAKDGNFIGYAKPFFSDMVIDKNGEQKAGRKVWAVVASAVKWIFSNKSKNQVATRIPMKGKFDKPKVGIWSAVGGILENAYIRAFTPALDDIGVKDVDKSH